MQNGYFQVVRTPGGYGLQIFQPKDGGEDVRLQEVMDYLDRQSIPYDSMSIKRRYSQKKTRSAFWNERIVRKSRNPVV